MKVDRATRERLRELAGKCESECEEWHQPRCDFPQAANPATIRALLDALEAAEADSQRLDWLDGHGCQDDAFYTEEFANNWRAAIDAASARLREEKS
jgi:hypothetical protein